MGQNKLSRHLALKAPILCFLSIVSSILAENLKAVECAAKLPTPRSHTNAIYDGDDTIYIFGGVDTRSLTETLSYSISHDRIAPACHLPTASYAAGAVINDRDQIFYLPGAYSSSNIDIYQYFPDSQTFNNVSRLQSGNLDYATIKTNDNKALLVGGGDQGNNILSLDLNTLTSENIHFLAEATRLAHGIWVEEQEAAYIFYVGGRIQKFTRATNTSEVLPITMSMYPVQAVWDGKFGYILGQNGTTNPVDEIVQFDQVTETVKYVTVEGYAGSKYMGFSWTTAVYAQKVNRIYIFGGSSSGNTKHDEIYYISLDPMSPLPTTTEMPTSITASPPNPMTMNPGIFDCYGRPDTVFPHPEDCSKFIICRDNHTYAFQCPDSLLFHPYMHCTFPDWVTCHACNYNK